MATTRKTRQETGNKPYIEHTLEDQTTDDLRRLDVQIAEAKRTKASWEWRLSVLEYQRAAVATKIAGPETGAEAVEVRCKLTPIVPLWEGTDILATT